MLKYADNSYYVGYTDDLEVRLGQHEAGTFPGYTRKRRPVSPVYSAEIPTRIEAWKPSAASKDRAARKKAALIEGDWETIFALARK